MCWWGQIRLWSSTRCQCPSDCLSSSTGRTVPLISWPFSSSLGRSSSSRSCRRLASPDGERGKQECASRPRSSGCGCFHGLGEADGSLYRVERKKLSDFPSGRAVCARGGHHSGFIAVLAEIKANMDRAWSNLA